jgi:hypothetical protein
VLARRAPAGPGGPPLALAGSRIAGDRSGVVTCPLRVHGIGGFCWLSRLALLGLQRRHQPPITSVSNRLLASNPSSRLCAIPCQASTSPVGCWTAGRDVAALLGLPPLRRPAPRGGQDGHQTTTRTTRRPGDPASPRPAGSSQDQRTDPAEQYARALAAEAARSLAKDPERWHHKRTSEVSRRPGERRGRAMP